MKRTRLLGVFYDNGSREEALQSALELLRQKKRATVLFLNIDCLEKSQKDPDYRDILNRADLVLPDGIGLRLATRLCGEGMRDNCNGTDFSPRLMEAAAKAGHKLFLMGGRPGVAEGAARALSQKIPGIQVAGTASGFFEDDRAVVDNINASGADLLFVAMGVPLQEKWIARNREALRPRLCLGVGALLDFLSGRMPRAPRLLQRLHLEWCWRMAVEPHRLFKRYLVNDLGFLISLLFKKNKMEA